MSGTPFRDAKGRPVVPGGDGFGDAWETLDGAPMVGRPHGDAENIRLHYPSREIAFELRAPRGQNRTKGRAAVKPWDARLEMPDAVKRLLGIPVEP